ncbi:MAG: ribonuclease HI family protein, partial [Candidatus Limnocylindrus sp.]
MPPRAYIIRTDGACRGNPGPASIGVALYDAASHGSDDPDAIPVASISAAIGTTTNNVAEWRAVIAAIDFAAELGAREIDLLLDSKLVVEQLQGRWRVRDAKLAPLCDEALKGLTRFAHWGARHVPREQNGRADALANEALDRALRGGPSWVARRPHDLGTAANAVPVGAELSATAATRVTILGSGASR